MKINVTEVGDDNEGIEDDIPEFDRLKKDDEVLEAVFHKSVYAFSDKFVKAVLVFFVFFLLELYLGPFVSPFYILIVGFLIISSIIIKTWYIWSRSLFMVTNIRVIALDQQTVFNRQKQEALLKDVCQVGERIEGFRQAMFHFGDVLVQTEIDLWLCDIENPREVTEAIFRALHRTKHEGVKALPDRFWKKKGRKR